MTDTNLTGKSMTTRKKIALAVLSVLVVFLGYAAARSPDYVISREITINAPAERVFPYLDSAKLGESWGPWLEVDPDAKMSYSGPESGVGSRASWTDGKQLGTGSATIVESEPNRRVGVKLEYVEPMVMTQHSDYILDAAGDRTRVTWRVTGKNNFVGRLMCLFVNMDGVVGGMFEKGLAKLKGLVEAREIAR